VYSETHHRALLEQAEASIHARTDGVREGMVALDASGRTILQKTGTETEIEFTREEVRLLADRADGVVHSHGDDTPPSIEDLAFAAVVAPRELVAFGPDVRWRLLRGKAWPATRTLLGAFNRIDRQTQRVLMDEKRAGRFGGDPFSWADRSAVVWEQFQRDHVDWFTLVREERHYGRAART
jgi:hypothetical protein